MAARRQATGLAIGDPGTHRGLSGPDSAVAPPVPDTAIGTLERRLRELDHVIGRLEADAPARQASPEAAELRSSASGMLLRGLDRDDEQGSARRDEAPQAAPLDSGAPKTGEADAQDNEATEPWSDRQEAPCIARHKDSGVVAPRPVLWTRLAIAFQLAVAAVAASALYVSLRGYSSVAPAPVAPATGLSSAPAASPLAEAGISGGRDSEAAEPTGSKATAAATPPLPLPTSYGVYALSNNRLIELQEVATAPVDPRSRTVLQISTPSQTVIADTRLSFIAFRRELATSAPDKVPVRIAARIARAMNFDASGKPAVTAPPTESWLIRTEGYDLRVSPVRESQEMILMRPPDSAFSFPAGRYELMLGGQAYDFVVAGTVNDPAQCVESVATVRGPAFYECRRQ